MAHYTLRFTGRTAPTAAGIGTPMLFATDSGTYLTNTRDLLPADPVKPPGTHDDALEAVVETVRPRTVQLSERRLDVPAASPHMLEPNFWMANAPGSTFVGVRLFLVAIIGLLIWVTISTSWRWLLRTGPATTGRTTCRVGRASICGTRSLLTTNSR